MTAELVAMPAIAFELKTDFAPGSFAATALPVEETVEAVLLEVEVLDVADCALVDWTALPEVAMDPLC